MSLVLDVFTQWRDPVIGAQRKWVFTQMYRGPAAAASMKYFTIAFLALFFITQMYVTDDKQLPFRYVLIGGYSYSVGSAFFDLSWFALSRTFRPSVAKVAIIQAALLWLSSWWILTGLISVFIADWVPFWLYLTSGLLGFASMLYFDFYFRGRWGKSNEWFTGILMSAAMIAGLLFGFFGFTAWVFILPLMLVAAITYKLNSWGQASAAFSVAKSENHNCHNQIPSISKWQVNLQQYFGEKVNLLFGFKMLFSWSGVCVLFLLGVQWFDYNVRASDLYSGLYFGLVLGGTHSLLRERNTWSYLWLRQIGSRQALWRHSEMRFWIGHLCLVMLIGILILLGGLDEPRNIVYAAILTIASLALVRYANLAFPWFSWGKGKTEVGNPVISYVLLIALWCVMRGLWSAEDYFLIAGTSAALLLEALMIRRYAKQYILKIDLGAIRRAKLS